MNGKESKSEVSPKWDVSCDPNWSCVTFVGFPKTVFGLFLCASVIKCK